MTKHMCEIFSSRGLCPNPFLAVEVHSDGNVSVCCPSRLKEDYRYLGNVLNAEGANPIRALWNGGAACQLRRAMYEQRHNDSCQPYCPQLVALRQGRIPPWYAHLIDNTVYADIDAKVECMSSPYRAVSVACDGSCNLSCIMCRQEKQLVPSNTEKEVSDKVFKSLLADIDSLAFLELTGNGDPFHNQRVQKFLDDLAGKKLAHLSVRFITNGQMVTSKRLDDITRLGLKELSFSISVDAASASMYESIRQGGTWERLLSTMVLLAEKRRQGLIQKLGVSFVVMRRNIEEIEAFVHLARGWGADVVEFQRMHGVLAPGENIFEEQRKGDLDRLAEILRAPLFEEPWINTSSLKSS